MFKILFALSLLASTAQGQDALGEPTFKWSIQPCLEGSLCVTNLNTGVIEFRIKPGGGISFGEAYGTIYYGPTDPTKTTNEHHVGDLWFNTVQTASSSTAIGKVCYVAGRPGKWRSWGASRETVSRSITSAPSSVGQRAVVGSDCYMATCTTSTSCWAKLN